MSRQTKYNSSVPLWARERIGRGMTRKQLADSFGVNPDTVYEWAKRYPVFHEAIHGGGDGVGLAGGAS